MFRSLFYCKNVSRIFVSICLMRLEPLGDQLLEVSRISRLTQLCYRLLELLRVNPFLHKSDLFQTRDLQPLPMLDGAHKIGRLQE